jgi:hypothetical protein
VAELVAQHTAETGQRFEPEAVAHLHYLSAGHPWLVNALADQATRRDVPDRAVAITAAHIEAAKETIILERRTHIDSLLARLREDRVRRVLDPMLAGVHFVPGGSLDDDLAYVAGLGLLRSKAGRLGRRQPHLPRGDSAYAHAPRRRRSTADGVVRGRRRAARRAEADGGVADLLARRRPPRGGGLRVQRVGAAPDADGLPPAGGERRRAHRPRVRPRQGRARPAHHLEDPAHRRRGEAAAPDRDRGARPGAGGPLP